MRRHCLQLVVDCSFILLLCVIASQVEVTFAQTSPVRTQIVQPAPVNLNFEQGEVGQIPTGWVYPVPKSYAVEVTEVNPKAGKRAAVLRSIEGTQPDANEFGIIMQAIDATQFRGRRVRFRAAVRIENDDTMTRAQLWMRVDRSEKKTGFFDNMGDRPIFSKGWSYYEIVGDIDEDATVVNIGMLFLGKGKAWLDDASFEDLGKVVTRAEPARPLTREGLENVVAFTRLLGYVRHFHPSDEAAAANWNAFAIEGMRIVEGAKSSAELAKTLENLFRPVAPTVRVFPTGKTPSLPDGLKRPKDSATLVVVSWHHIGCGQVASKQSMYKSERVRRTLENGKLPVNSPDPQKPFTSVLGGGVSCLVPQALYSNASGTLPRAESSATETKAILERYTGNDRATRLADVALAWNVLQHFYPYFDVVKTDWQKALIDALKSAATDQNDRAFLNTLRRLVVQIHDGHGGVYHTSAFGPYTVPVMFGWVEGRLIVTEIAASGADGLQPGDIVVKIDDKPSADVLAEVEALISGATPQWRRFRALHELQIGQKDTEMRLAVQDHNGRLRDVVLRRTINAQALKESKPPKISELKPGIYYLDLDRIDDEDFQKILPQLEKATGIVFDLRGYPKVSPLPISHIIDKPVQSARWNVPIITSPDHLNMVDYVTDGRWTLEPIAPRLKAKIVFITGGGAISYAESYMGIIEAYKLAEIVGEPSAGTNGNVNPFVLPGEYTVVWTGMKVLKHDGTQHHGIGIHPTVPVSRTIRGVAEKRDEQLERAIVVVSQ